MPARCLVACADLMTSSRLTQTVRAAGLDAVAVRGTDDLRARHAEAPAVAVLVDLNDPAGGVAVVAAAHALEPRPIVLAIGPHVDAASMRAAKDAGADYTLPHSATGEPLRERLLEAAREKGA